MRVNTSTRSIPGTSRHPKPIEGVHWPLDQTLRAFLIAPAAVFAGRIWS
jgi:hypothetical protein